MYAGGCLNLSNDYPHVLIVLGFGITGDRDVLPDIDVLADGIRAGFEELASTLIPSTSTKESNRA